MRKFDPVMEVVISIGQKMLECGAEIHRAEVAMEMLLKKFGSEKYEVFTISSQITISSKFEGEIYTIIKRVQKYGNNFYRLEQFNSLCRKAINEDLSVEEIDKRINEILLTSKLPTWLIILGTILGASSFTFFFGGCALDAIISGLLGVVVVFSDKYIKPRLNGLVYSVFICFVVGSLGIGLFRLGLVHNIDKVLIGDVMLFIPGSTLTNSVRDIFLGDTISGTVRFIEAFLLACSIALGFALSMLIYMQGEIHAPSEVKWWISLIAGMFGTLGFCIIYHMRGIKLLFATLGGLLAMGVYLLVGLAISDTFTKVFIASISVGVYGEIMARVLKTPAICYVMPGGFPLYPGASLYYSLTHLVNGNNNLFWSYLGSTGITILGIASGVVLTSVLFKYLHRLFNYIAKVHKESKKSSSN